MSRDPAVEAAAKEISVMIFGEPVPHAEDYKWAERIVDAVRPHILAPAGTEAR